MNIIIEKQKDTRIKDGIDTILSIDNKSFDEIIEKLNPQESLEEISFFYTNDDFENNNAEVQLGLERTSDENGKFIGRSYYGGERFSILQIFKELENKKNNKKEDSFEYNRINRLLETRNLEAFKTFLISGNEDNREIVNKVFDILTNDETLEKFLDYKNNQDYCTINNESVDISEYLSYLGKIFGNKKNNTTIFKKFYIPELEEYKDRYSKIFENINIDRYVNPTYEFRTFTDLKRINNTVIRNGEEPEWNINEKLRTSVLDQMSDGLTLEEKAIYIYCKLCKELSYDEGYFFRDKLESGKYSHEFSQEHLEEIKPGSKVTCWDFSRIYSKFINELDGDIEAVIIAEGANYGHFLAGFYTDKVSAMVEAINGRTGGTNDLMKAKNGIKFEGIEIVSDRDGLINKAVNKIYPEIFGKEQYSIQDYVQKIKNLPKEDTSDNLEMKLQAFIETMRKNNISGNEAVQTLSAYHKAGFFGEQLDRAYLGKEEFINGEKSYKRKVLIRSQNEFKEKQNESPLYIMDLDSLEVSLCTSQEILEGIKTGTYVYESDNHKMPGIDMEEK